MRTNRTGLTRFLSGLLVFTLVIGPVLAGASYTVQRGDTLSAIAQRFAIPMQELSTRNHIANPNHIHVGQVLQLRDDSTTADQPAEVTPAPTPAVPDTATVTQRPLTGRELLAARSQWLEAQQHQQRGLQLVNAAQTYTGTPYRWGGLSSRGIDCSGLVVRAMAILGREVPHRAAALFNMGERVRYEQLQPGDLLFFNTRGSGVSHVGIWIGENKFIHASTGRGVTVDSVKGYYSRTLVGARRLH